LFRPQAAAPAGTGSTPSARVSPARSSGTAAISSVHASDSASGASAAPIATGSSTGERVANTANTITPTRTISGRATAVAISAGLRPLASSALSSGSEGAESCWSAVSDIAVWTSRNTVAARWEDRTGRSVRAARGGRAHGTGTRRCAAVPAGPGRKGDRAMQSQHSPQTVGQAGEFAVIAAAVAATDGGPDPRVVVDTGDDAAVLRAGDGTVTVCTDMLVEGRHFRLDWSAPADVGHKAIAQNAADIAAMGAVPTGLTVALACPAETDVRVAGEIQRGRAAASPPARRHHALALHPAGIAAMGAVPTGFPVALACPAATDVRAAVEIQRGLAAGAAAAGARVVGGDLVQAGQIVVSVTALG